MRPYTGSVAPAVTACRQWSDSIAMRAGQIRPATSRPLVLASWGSVALISLAALLLYSLLLTRAGLAVSAPELSAVLAASTLSSVVGFAFSPICSTMLLPMIDDPVRLVQILMVSSIPMQALNVAALWRDISFKDLSRFLLGGMLGVPVGTWLLAQLGHAGFRQIIGVLLTAFVAYTLLNRSQRIVRQNRLAEIGMGFIGGLTGGLAAFPSGPLIIWCKLQGWDKRRQRALYQPFILAIQVLGLVLIQAMHVGGGTVHPWQLGLLAFAPVSLMGGCVGMMIFRQMSDRSFATAVNVLLLVSGIGLIL